MPRRQHDNQDMDKSRDDWLKLTVKDLRLKCNQYSLTENGSKQTLAKRLFDKFHPPSAPEGSTVGEIATIRSELAELRTLLTTHVQAVQSNVVVPQNPTAHINNEVPITVPEIAPNIANNNPGTVPLVPIALRENSAPIVGIPESDQHAEPIPLAVLQNTLPIAGRTVEQQQQITADPQQFAMIQQPYSSGPLFTQQTPPQMLQQPQHTIAAPLFTQPSLIQQQQTTQPGIFFSPTNNPFPTPCN